MLILRKPQKTEKTLVLGDYVSVHSSAPKRGDVQNAEPDAVLLNREEFFQRIHKQRGAFLPRIQKPKGDLIDVRLRAAATQKTGWKHVSEIATPEDKVVA